MSKDSLRDSAWFYAWMTVHNIWTVNCQIHSTAVTAEEIPEEASRGLKREAVLDVEQQYVKLSSQLSSREARAEMSSSQRSREHAEIQ